MSVGFFLDSADFSWKKASEELGLRVLSILAEMDLQNRQVLRLLAYRLQQAGEVQLALPVFERMLELAPHEPQSHRDLGLALAQAGQAQRAVERLYAVVTGSWDARFADIDLIALRELNAVVAKAGRDGKPVDVAAIEPRLLRNLPLDVVSCWPGMPTTPTSTCTSSTRTARRFLRPQPVVPGRHDQPRRDRRLWPRNSRCTTRSRASPRRRQLLRPSPAGADTSTGIMLWLSSGFATPGQQDRGRRSG